MNFGPLTTEPKPGARWVQKLMRGPMDSSRWAPTLWAYWSAQGARTPDLVRLVTSR